MFVKISPQLFNPIIHVHFTMMMGFLNFISACVSLFLLSPMLYVMSITPEESNQLFEIVKRFLVYDFNYIEVGMKKNHYHGLRSIFDDVIYKNQLVDSLKVTGKKTIECVQTDYFHVNEINYNEKRKQIIGLLQCKYIDYISDINRLLSYLVTEYLSYSVRSEVDPNTKNDKNGNEMLGLIKETNESYIQFVEGIVKNVEFLKLSFKDEKLELISFLKNKIIKRSYIDGNNIEQYYGSLQDSFGDLQGSEQLHCKFLKSTLKEIDYEKEYNYTKKVNKKSITPKITYANFLADMIYEIIEDYLKYDYTMNKNEFNSD